MISFAILKRPLWIVVIVLTGIAWVIYSGASNQYLTGNVSHIKFSSDYLGDSRRVWIYLPPDYGNTDDHYPVLYMHDGQNVFDGNTSTHQGIEWRVDETLEEVISSGEIPGLIVIAIESNDKRHDEYLPERVQLMGVMEGGDSHLYASMLIEELIPLINSLYRTKTGPKNTFIGGSSYGGILSFYLTIQHADVFGTGLIFSPSLQWNSEWMTKQVMNLHWKTEAHFWVSMGGQDDGEPGAFYRFRRALESKGWQSPYEIGGLLDGRGNHSEASWARSFPLAMNWLFNEAVFTDFNEH